MGNKLKLPKRLFDFDPDSGLRLRKNDKKKQIEKFKKPNEKRKKDKFFVFRLDTSKRVVTCTDVEEYKDFFLVKDGILSLRDIEVNEQDLQYYTLNNGVFESLDKDKRRIFISRNADVLKIVSSLVKKMYVVGYNDAFDYFMKPSEKIL